MKTLIAAAALITFVLAEPPPSNSYLPPSASGRAGGGYPQGPQGHVGPGFGAGPQVVAARTGDLGHGLKHSHDHGAAAGGFGRSGPQGHAHGAKGKHGDHGHGSYDQNASPFGRSGLDDVDGEPANYNFGYMVNDYQEGTDFGHHEERQDERAEGEYHVVLPDGRKQTVSYEADERGFKPHISYEDTDAVGRSGGYDSNANNIGKDHHGFSNNARAGGY